MIEVLAVASEMHPLIKTGGLADVVGALPPALARHGVRVTTLLPGYPAVMRAVGAAPPVATLANWFGGTATLRRGSAHGLPQSTFYPLGDGPSIQNHRITMSCFRICSTCQSRS